MFIAHLTGLLSLASALSFAFIRFGKYEPLRIAIEKKVGITHDMFGVPHPDSMKQKIVAIALRKKVAQGISLVVWVVITGLFLTSL